MGGQVEQQGRSNLRTVSPALLLSRFAFSGTDQQNKVGSLSGRK
jgi:hypothetical protein